ncbi:MAG: hypothetical protein FWG14_08050, partial [Peptococcaceae bacterium]|nr:hypothetical protein [Peptococcaceae bacterium]
LTSLRCVQTVEFCGAVAKNRINPFAKSLLINVRLLCVAFIREPNKFIPYIATTINWCAPMNRNETLPESRGFLSVSGYTMEESAQPPCVNFRK